jgi:hypothetical protein
MNSGLNCAGGPVTYTTCSQPVPFITPVYFRQNVSRISQLRKQKMHSKSNRPEYFFEKSTAVLIKGAGTFTDRRQAADDPGNLGLDSRHSLPIFRLPWPRGPRSERDIRDILPSSFVTKCSTRQMTLNLRSSHSREILIFLRHLIVTYPVGPISWVASDD